MIMEIRDFKTLKLLDSKEIKNNKEYVKTYKKLTKMVLRHNKINKKDMELLVRVRPHSYTIKDGNYGYVVGLKESKSRWI